MCDVAIIMKATRFADQERTVVVVSRDNILGSLSTCCASAATTRTKRHQLRSACATWCKTDFGCVWGTLRMCTPMVQTRSQTAARLQSVIDDLQSEIDVATIDRFIVQAVNPAEVCKNLAHHQRCPRATQLVEQYLAATDRAQGRAAKIVVADRLLNFLAQPASTSLVTLHPRFALSVLLKLDEFRRESGYPTESADRPRRGDFPTARHVRTRGVLRPPDRADDAYH